MTRRYFTHKIKGHLEQSTWKHASEAHLGSGLELGEPNFGPADKAAKKLAKNGELAVAKAIPILVTNRVYEARPARLRN